MSAPVKAQHADPAPYRVAVCVPSGDQVAAPFAESLAEMMAFTGMTLCADNLVELGLLWKSGTYIDQARDQLARKALDWKATHILWLDSDMMFPKDTLIQLMNRNQAIVGANYSTRKMPCRPVAMKKVNPQPPDDYLQTHEHSTGLEAVEIIGFGCVLTRFDVYEKVSKQNTDKSPFFLCDYGGQGRGFRGEDVYFCDRAREHGFEVMVDHDLSKQVGHVGSFQFGLHHVAAFQEPAIQVVSG